MTKYTVIYERTVRVREYETLKIGIHREFEAKNDRDQTGFDVCAFIVDTQIEENLERLRR